MRRCHGPAIFPGVIDASTGKPIINWKTITGFTTEGEDVIGLMGTVRTWKNLLLKNTLSNMVPSARIHLNCLRELQLTFTGLCLLLRIDSRPPGVWDLFHISDGRLVTGTNPASAKETTRVAVKAFNRLVKRIRHCHIYVVNHNYSNSFIQDLIFNKLLWGLFITVCMDPACLAAV